MLRNHHFAWVALGLLLILASNANALITVGGKDPVADHDWPAGSLDAANDRSRVSWYEGPPFGGGQWVFQYRGDTAAFNEVVAKFAAIKSPQLTLVIHDGEGHNPVAASDKDAPRVDWTLTLWVPENFYHLFANSQSLDLSSQPEFRGSLPGPQLDVWPGSGGVDWTVVRLPQGLKIDDERAANHGYAPEDGSVVVGSAYDMLSSKPVAEAQVAIIQYGKKGAPKEAMGWNQVATAVADAEGRFEIKKLPAGYSYVVIRRDGYAPRVLGYFQSARHGYKSYVAWLSPAVAQKGKVVDTAGKPLAGVHVRLDGSSAVNGQGYPTHLVNENPQVLTDAEGRFTLKDLPRGNVWLFAWGDNLFQLDSLRQITVPADEIALTMTATGSIHVKAIDSSGKAATGSVNVWDQRGELPGTWGGSANLDDQGIRTFNDVPPGKYFVSTDPMARFNKGSGATLIEVTSGHTVEVELKGK